MDYDVLRWVAAGFPLHVLGRHEEWSLVEDFRKRRGWVANWLLAENNSVILKIKKENLYSGADENDTIVTEIEYGTVMQTEEVQGNWLKVVTGEGLEGWLPKESVWPE